MPIKTIKNNSGITLVETMVSILIFGLLTVGMLNVCVQSVVLGKRSEFSYTANNLAKNHIDTLKSMPFSNLATADETDTLIDSLGVPTNEGSFKRNTTVTTSYAGDADLVALTVTVDYQVRGEFTGSPVTLSTVIFQYA